MNTRKVKTVKIKNAIDYAKVADRLKIFREENPRAKIMTESRMVDGKIIFKAYIWKDRNELMELIKSGLEKEILMMSADSNGSSQKEDNKAEKNFEKLETVAVGRALALLGYGVDGEIASSEEMEEFEEFKKNQAEEKAKLAVEQIKNSKTMKELQANFAKFATEFKNDTEILAKIIEAKDEMKGKLK